MASIPLLPLRLLGRAKGKFKVFDKREYADLKVDHFDILTHVWGNTCDPYDCKIDGVSWNVILSRRKIKNITRLMDKAKIEYLWVDSLCLNQEDETEMNVEVLKMYEYYKSARKCYALMEMHDVWDPQNIVTDLRHIDHILTYMTGTALAEEAGMGRNVINFLDKWSNANWVFPMDRTTAMSAAIELGVLNCYATCIGRVKSLFKNEYFTRVWTFQEMLLGKNITIYGINEVDIECVGQLMTWMNLATDCVDKALKLRDWIDRSRDIKNALVYTVMRIINEDLLNLGFLKAQARGINSAKSDIINGGPFWWHDNCELFWG
ncbi:Heterokaryon incompatibility protein [Rutstroemia sp. NJR-2017a BVV2]|nr:Heterokaryon incompatibility protein [Rutstroemia sp. NJR-2017a BVV2]